MEQTLPLHSVWGFGGLGFRGYGSRLGDEGVGVGYFSHPVRAYTRKRFKALRTHTIIPIQVVLSGGNTSGCSKIFPFQDDNDD